MTTAAADEDFIDHVGNVVSYLGHTWIVLPYIICAFITMRVIAGRTAWLDSGGDPRAVPKKKDEALFFGFLGGLVWPVIWGIWAFESNNVVLSTIFFHQPPEVRKVRQSTSKDLVKKRKQPVSRVKKKEIEATDDAAYTP